MNSSQAIAYDDASYEADAAVVAASLGDFADASDHVRSAFAAVRSSPYRRQVESVHALGGDALAVLGAPDAERDAVGPTLEAFRAAVERCHGHVHADARRA